MWILGQGKISEYDDGNPVRFTGTHLDITKRKQAEETLQEALEFKDKILSESPIGITIY